MFLNGLENLALVLVVFGFGMGVAQLGTVGLL